MREDSPQARINQAYQHRECTMK